MFGGGLNLIPKNPILDNFVRAWTVANFRVYFWNTVVVTFAVVVIVVLRTALTGYALGRYDFPGKKILRAALVEIGRASCRDTIIPLFDLIKAMGLLNTRWAIILGESGGAHVVFVLLFAGFFASRWPGPSSPPPRSCALCGPGTRSLSRWSSRWPGPTCVRWASVCTPS